MEQIAVGIDIGGTTTKFGFVDINGNILARSVMPTTGFDDATAFAEVLASEVTKVLQQAGTPPVKGVGIGAPNGNFFNGTIEYAPNLKWEGIIPLASMMAHHLGFPVVLTNDANAAAIGEMIYGAANGMKDFIFITLGTGVGSGIVANGNMIYGHDGFAGEIGHVILQPGGRLCGCGRQGCVETYCSATGIARTYLEILSNKGKQPDIDFKNVDAKHVFTMANKGDNSAIESFEYTGKMLGLALANSVAYTSPEAIFLFGGLANAGDLLFRPTKISFENNLLKIYKNKIKILPSGLPENDAAILGAASLAWKEIG
ncbi:MAG: ROK family protein [Bacteroidota bacterium]